jgi:hypothetical protein
MSYPYFLGSNRWPVVPRIQDPDNEREREMGSVQLTVSTGEDGGGSGIGLAA